MHVYVLDFQLHVCHPPSPLPPPPPLSVHAGVFGVTLTGFILHRTGSWALVFSIITAANLLALLFYLAFGSGKRLQLDPS